MGDDRGDRPRTNGREYITTRWVLGVAGTLIFLLLTISAGMFHARMAALETANATTQQQTAETDGRVRALEGGGGRPASSRSAGAGSARRAGTRPDPREVADEMGGSAPSGNAPDRDARARRRTGLRIRDDARQRRGVSLRRRHGCDFLVLAAADGTRGRDAAAHGGPETGEAMSDRTRPPRIFRRRGRFSRSNI